jgi:hypothetical protein
MTRTAVIQEGGRRLLITGLLPVAAELAFAAPGLPVCRPYLDRGLLGPS